MMSKQVSINGKNMQIMLLINADHSHTCI